MQRLIQKRFTSLTCRAIRKQLKLSRSQCQNSVSIKVPFLWIHHVRQNPNNGLDILIAD